MVLLFYPCQIATVLKGNLDRLVKAFQIGRSTVRVKYGLQVLGPVCLEEVVAGFLEETTEKKS